MKYTYRKLAELLNMKTTGTLTFSQVGEYLAERYDYVAILYLSSGLIAVETKPSAFCCTGQRLSVKEYKAWKKRAVKNGCQIAEVGF